MSERCDFHTDFRQEELLNLLKRGRTEEFLCKRLKTSPTVLHALIDDAKRQGFQIVEVGGELKLRKEIIPTESRYVYEWDGQKVFRLGVVADTHLSSKWQQITYLNKVYDIFADREVPEVLHAGDLTEGHNMHPGHEFEVFNHGADEQAEYVVAKYPKRKGITTKFITGNHDHSLIKKVGHDIGKAIALQRKDMVYLGPSNATIVLTPNCTVEINHPTDGAAYSLSYSLQRTLDAIPSGQKPSIFLNGHHHKLFYMFYRNIHSFECGTLEAQTPWMKGKRISAHLGAFILEVHVDREGTITRLYPEMLPFYESIESDY